MTLRFSKLGCSKGGRRLFRDIDCEVPAGRWLYVKGPNGVGKTSLLRMVCGLSSLDQGDIAWHGASIRGLPETYRRDIRFLGHLNALQDAMTVAENLRFGCALHGVALEQEACRAVLARFGLRGREQQIARHLSQGQRRRVALARLTLSPGRLWILDEPYVAMDDAGIGLLADMIANHLDGGGTAVITSHQQVAIPGHPPLLLELGA
ncbi:cytochrome c biogenesis heme-transporting ATPase CcmA [Curvibacter sp. APW13]|uniref:cytochrome c biogenesis heme-transporting ATPase CcmA n=1 Tax=Curvibacter sp. APW13 TaxID=3077236 RepID=UPI0028DDC9F6|nr:cytochrome c biogenesis heme-transporting ATPase CcmA [Curvibacter sp. APW13]MDT8991889.1 cytochrome c biogenesis heme-transporting ATPase CcmA [Curvibacter sp. APW13]